MMMLRAAVSLAFIGAATAGCTSGPITCYTDDQPLGTRVLGNPVNGAEGGAASLAICAQTCADKKMKLAGVEYGGQCMCGNAVAAGAKKLSAPTACQYPCTHNKTEKCGGQFEIGVFSFTCSGTPVPIPPPPAPPPHAPPHLNKPCAHFNEYGCAEIYNPCINETSPQSKMPFCNHKLPIDERVKDAVGRMTLKEKIANLDTGGAPIKGLDTPAYNWWSEASTGVANEIHHSSTQTTKFAFPITTGMSFNRTLWKVTGARIGREGRAMMNAGNGFSSFWAPVINLAREPRWGRNIETPGEDPYRKYTPLSPPTSLISRGTMRLRLFGQEKV